MKPVRVVNQYTKFSDFWNMDEICVDLEVTEVPEKFIKAISKYKYFGGGYFGISLANTGMGIAIDLDKTHTKQLYYVDEKGNRHYISGTFHLNCNDCIEFFKQHLIDKGEYVDNFEILMDKISKMSPEEKDVIRPLFAGVLGDSK